jgi:dihydroflavonol-4-reductase
MGPRDLKFISGELIVQALKRGIPGVPPGGLNYIDVRDAAEGHVAAAEKGRPGERYILGGNNMTHREVIDTISRVVGVRPPALDIPGWAIPPMAVVFDLLKAVGVQLPGNVDGDALRLSREFLYYDTGKAERDLGLKGRPFEESARDAYEWYKANGYLEKAGVKPVA